MSSLDILKYILNSFEIAACITGFIYWKKFHGTYWKWFPFYLLFIVVVEFTGKFLTYARMNEIKKAIYDYVSIPAEILFYFFIFYNEFKTSKFKWISIACIVVYITCLFVDSFFLKNKYDWFFTFSYSAGVILLVVNILIFFFGLITSNQMLYFHENILFWISIGLLMFYLGSLPFQGIMTYLYAKQRIVFLNYMYMFYIFNCLMYSSFIIGFICGKVKS